MLAFGQITDIDPSSGYVRVNIPDYGIVTEFIPFLRRFAGASSESLLFEVDELVVVGRTDTERWFVLGAAPNDVAKPYSGASASKLGVKFSDGCLVEYDTQSHKLTINTTGEVDITGGENVTIKAVNVKIDGILTVTGDLVAEADLSAGGDITGGSGVSLDDHVHTAVQSGAGVSGPPQLS